MLVSVIGVVVAGGGVVEFCIVLVFAKLVIFELTKPTVEEAVASFGELAGRNEMGDNDFRLIPDTMFEICPLLPVLIGIRCWC